MVAAVSVSAVAVLLAVALAWGFVAVLRAWRSDLRESRATNARVADQLDSIRRTLVVLVERFPAPALPPAGFALNGSAHVA